MSLSCRELSLRIVVRQALPGMSCDSDTRIRDMEDMGGWQPRRHLGQTPAGGRRETGESAPELVESIYMGRGLGIGVNSALSKSSNLRRAFWRAGPSN